MKAPEKIHVERPHPAGFVTHRTLCGLPIGKVDYVTMHDRRSARAVTCVRCMKAAEKRVLELTYERLTWALFASKGDRVNAARLTGELSS